MADPQYHALERYVGTPYDARSFDCLDLAVLVQAEVFGRTVAVPVRAQPVGTAVQRRQVAAMSRQLATPVEEPFTGCAVLLSEPTAAGDLVHIGTVGMRQNEPWVLHNSEKLGGACLQRLAALRQMGMRLEGFYEWK